MWKLSLTCIKEASGKALKAATSTRARPGTEPSYLMTRFPEVPRTHACLLVRAGRSAACSGRRGGGLRGQGVKVMGEVALGKLRPSCSRYHWCLAEIPVTCLVPLSLSRDQCWLSLAHGLILRLSVVSGTHFTPGLLGGYTSPELGGGRMANDLHQRYKGLGSALREQVCDAFPTP